MNDLDKQASVWCLNSPYSTNFKVLRQNKKNTRSSFTFSRRVYYFYLSTQASLKLSNRWAAYGSILSSGTQQVTLVPGYWQFSYVKKVKSNLQLSTKWLFIKFYLLVLLQQGRQNSCSFHWQLCKINLHFNIENLQLHNLEFKYIQ